MMFSRPDRLYKKKRNSHSQEPKRLESLNNHEKFLLDKFCARNCVENVRAVGQRHYYKPAAVPVAILNDSTEYSATFEDQVETGDVVSIALPLDILLHLTDIEYDVHKGQYVHTEAREAKFTEIITQDQFESKMRAAYPSLADAYGQYKMLLALVSGESYK